MAPKQHRLGKLGKLGRMEAYGLIDRLDARQCTARKRVRTAREAQYGWSCSTTPTERARPTHGAAPPRAHPMVVGDFGRSPSADRQSCMSQWHSSCPHHRGALLPTSQPKVSTLAPRLALACPWGEPDRALERASSVVSYSAFSQMSPQRGSLSLVFVGYSHVANHLVKPKTALPLTD